MYTFIAPYLLLIIPLGCVGVYLCYRKYAASQEIMHLSDIQQIYHTSSKYLYLLYTGLFLSMTCVGIILAHPVSYEYSGEQDEYFIDIGVILDSSYSMLAEDIYPNRFEASTKMIEEFIQESR